jgi:hypothetical protein
LAQFPDINKYLITSHHVETDDPKTLREEITAKHIVNEETNTHYLSSYVRNWSNDTFFEFMINENADVSVNYRVKGENF